MFSIVVLEICACPLALNAMSMPLLEKPLITQFSIKRVLPERNRMPLIPVPEPCRERFRKTTTSLAPACTTIPSVADTRIEATCPAPPSMVMGLVMVNEPYEPGSRTSTSPPAAVLKMAPSKVLHGRLRVQGLPSLPAPDTQVREDCACISVVPSTIITKELITILVLFIVS